MTIDAVSDLDLSYTPPLGSPWEAVQMGTQAWVRDTRHKPASGCSEVESVTLLSQANRPRRVRPLPRRHTFPRRARAAVAERDQAPCGPSRPSGLGAGNSTRRAFAPPARRTVATYAGRNGMRCACRNDTIERTYPADRPD
jgi:hypothetical protein